MKLLVDSSVWVDFLNGYPSKEAVALRQAIEEGVDLCTCGVVVAEIFQGLKRKKGREDLAALFRDLTFLEAQGIDLHLRSAQVYRELRKRGRTVRSTIDCLIAVLAEESCSYLLARDRDLDVIIDSRLLTLRRWPVAEQG